MQPLIKKYLGTLIRAGLLVFVGWVGVDIADGKVDDLAATLAVVVWGLWEKYSSRQNLVTALAMPNPTTENAVAATVKSGGAPSVMTPKDEVPQLAGG